MSETPSETPGEWHDDTEGPVVYEPEPPPTQQVPTDGSEGVLTGQVPVIPEVPVTAPPKPPKPDCPEHVEVRHDDNLPPWCDTCGWAYGLPVLGDAPLGRLSSQ